MKRIWNIDTSISYCRTITRYYRDNKTGGQKKPRQAGGMQEIRTVSRPLRASNDSGASHASRSDGNYGYSLVCDAFYTSLSVRPERPSGLSGCQAIACSLICQHRPLFGPNGPQGDPRAPGKSLREFPDERGSILLDSAIF